MDARIVYFGTSQSDGILAALVANGYQVAACGTSILKLKQMLQQRDEVDALAVTEDDAPKALDILSTVRSIRKVPLILFQDDNRTSHTSHFDLAIPSDVPLPALLDRVAALIEQSRSLRAELRMSREQHHSLIGVSASLRQEATAARVESRRIWAKLGNVKGERLSIRSVLVVDDYARWRETMCSMLKDRAECLMLCEAQDGVEAVEMATELKPQLILLDLDLPRQNGIEAARQIARSSPSSVILFVSMNNCADIVGAALSAGAKGFLLKADAPTELLPAIKAVLENKQYLSPNLRAVYSDDIN